MHISNLMKAFIVISIHTQVTCAKVFNCPALAGDPGNNIGWCWREILAKDRANELETIRLDGRDFFGKSNLCICFSSEMIADQSGLH
ncbi:hypothetical protein Pst134EA_033385 [Puccinia striiformis f. sp. tritici]|uniref:hypothetical protein n=1 Tax=Puccinia striiformis f. sp. tritici TaxID=168172 RepID=UPI002008113F|nr:hypothetical protein Pst134EA_033385 [Puccinia striiformis f. sp. tritici]KAH9469401.1 hypothetical protein Pst134EA_033385 [Puccinia striiformis f. sp. tritici]